MSEQEFLDSFEHSICSQRKTYDSTYVAFLPSGSKIYRKEAKGKTIHQLFLNQKEYTEMQKKFSSNRHIHFYGGYYIYLNEFLYLKPFLKTLLET